jgi:hypothetical protein
MPASKPVSLPVPLDPREALRRAMMVKPEPKEPKQKKAKTPKGE